MQDLGVVAAILGSAIAIIGVIIALFLWMRGEANADRRDIVNLIITMKQEAENFRKEMALEIKDFHGRLCAIEERRSK